MPPPSIDDISIAFSAESLFVLNLCLGFIMFGVALAIDPVDFKKVARAPKAIGAGVLSQFVLLPAVTFVLVWVAEPHPAIALGMILVAACPGGNISNFISSLSRADVALSVGLTALATLLSPLFTPLNFEFWADMLPQTRAFKLQFGLSYFDMLRTVLVLLVLPLLAGMAFRKWQPTLAGRIEGPVRVLSLLILMGFIGVALANNFNAFRDHLYAVFFLVLIHNSLALGTGYFTGRLSGLNPARRRTLAIETGIQNSGLGLIVIFNFFGANGGMAVVAAWWGVWHILSGLLVAGLFRLSDAGLLRAPRLS